MAKLVKGLNYRQWQQRNSSHFKSLSKEAQKELRKKGYRNVGWDKVRESWAILSESKLVYLVDHQLKSGDLAGAQNTVRIESANAKKQASKTLKNIQQTRNKLNDLMANAVNKYSRV